MTDPGDSAPASFLRLPQVEARTGLGKTTIYMRMRSGSFPSAVKLGARTAVWSSAAIDQWMLEQLAAAKKRRIAVLLGGPSA